MKFIVAILVLTSMSVFARTQQITCKEGEKLLTITHEFDGEFLKTSHVALRGIAASDVVVKNVHALHSMPVSHLHGPFGEKGEAATVFRVVTPKNILGRQFEEGKMHADIRLDLIHRTDFSAEITPELSYLVFRQLSSEGRLIEMMSFRHGCSSRIQ